MPGWGAGRKTSAELGHSFRNTSSTWPITRVIDGMTGKPSAAKPIANSSTSGKRQVPNRSSISNHPPKAPGTTAGSRPVPGMRSTPRCRNASIVAVRGAGPCPQTTTTSSLFAS